jgi:hypothetical protein
MQAMKTTLMPMSPNYVSQFRQNAENNKVVQVLEKNRRLCRSKLVAFKEEKDLSGLKSASSHMSQRDKRVADKILDPSIETRPS